MTAKNKVIIDGDWGGDEMQLSAVLLAHPDKVEVLGATSTFGNVGHDQVFENGRNILNFLGATNIPCYPGARSSSGTDAPLEGDGAHGGDGIGNVSLKESTAPRETKNSVDYILDTLKSNEAGTITITASGPLTNIAQAFKKDPETMKRVKEIVVMGGCTYDIKTKDMPDRRGNITLHGEFNFQQASHDARDVMESGLPITLLPMNCTHQLTVTPERQRAIKDAFRSNPRSASAILGMMNAPIDFDEYKFKSAPVMHDVNCALYLLHPEEYVTERGKVPVAVIPYSEEWQGRTEFEPSEQGNIKVAKDIRNPDKLFDVYLDSLKKRVLPQSKDKQLQTPHIMVVGSSIMDMVTYGNKFPGPGETVLADDFETGFGGKGANQAVAAKKSGANVSMISCVGDDANGKATIQNFKDNGIDTTSVSTIKGKPTGAAPIFVETSSGQNSISVVLGANKEISSDMVDAAMKSGKPDAVVMQCEMPLETVYHTTKYAKKNGIISLLNVAPAQPVDLKKLSGLDYLVVNESEAKTISGEDVTDKDSAIKVGKKLLEDSEIGQVIVTLGEKGAVLVGRRKNIYIDQFPVKTIDTSGAGDAWLGCFATAIAEGRSEDDAMKRANLFAAMSTEKKGTQKSYPTTEEFNAAIAEHIPARQIAA